MEEMKTKVFIADVLPLYQPLQLAKYRDCISPERREAVDRLKSIKAQALSVGAEVLLHEGLVQLFGISDHLRLAKGDHGKPILLDYDDIHFNLSHSGNFVVCILNTQSVGIDIQQMDRMNIKIAKRFFHPGEVDWLLSLPDKYQKQGSCELWSIKESYMKYTGKGFSLPMKAFEVKISGQFPENIEVSIFEAGRKENVYLKKFNGPENYVLWCAGASNQFEDGIEWVKL